MEHVKWVLIGSIILKPLMDIVVKQAVVKQATNLILNQQNQSVTYVYVKS